MTTGLAARPDRAVFAVSVIIAATFMMSLQDAIVKFVSADIPLWQLHTVRSLVAIPMLIAAMYMQRRQVEIRPRAVGWAFLRSTLLVLMYVSFFAALPVVELSVVAAAYYTGPLFITLFSALLIGERVGPVRALGIVTGFLGVLVILRPGSEAFSYAMLLPVASAVLYALAAIVTRSRCVADSAFSLSLTLNFCFILSGLLGTGVIAIWDPTPAQSAVYPFLLGHWVPFGAREWGVIVVLATASVGVHLCLAKAYQSAAPSTVATFDYAYLLFAVGWGYLIFAEIPDLATVIGMAMITGAGLFVILREQRTRPAGR